MTKIVIPVALALLLACAGCAGRMGATPADLTPAAVPRSTPQPSPPTKPAAPASPVTGTGSQDPPAASASAAQNPPAATSSAATSQAAKGEAPPATASAYVYSPQQAISAPPAPSPSAAPSSQGGVPPAPSKSVAPADTAPPQGQDASSGLPGGELQLLVVASDSEIATGAIVTVDVMASSSTAVVDAPLHLSFDPNVLGFVDGAPGDFLTQGGSSVVFLVDGQSHPGDVAVAAGRTERERGASGAGLLCRIRFRGVGVGATPVVVGQARAWGTAGETLAVRSAGTTVVVR